MSVISAFWLAFRFVVVCVGFAIAIYVVKVVFMYILWRLLRRIKVGERGASEI